MSAAVRTYGQAEGPDVKSPQALINVEEDGWAGCEPLTTQEHVVVLNVAVS